MQSKWEEEEETRREKGRRIGKRRGGAEGGGGEGHVYKHNTTIDSHIDEGAGSVYDLRPEKDILRCLTSAQGAVDVLIEQLSLSGDSIWQRSSWHF